jgi:hypothetical protein
VTREEFEAIDDHAFPVLLANGLMGMCNHWDDAGVLVDVIKGNENLCVLRVPWANFTDLNPPNGALFATLDGAELHGLA